MLIGHNLPAEELTCHRIMTEVSRVPNMGTPSKESTYWICLSFAEFYFLSPIPFNLQTIMTHICGALDWAILKPAVAGPFSLDEIRNRLEGRLPAVKSPKTANREKI